VSDADLRTLLIEDPERGWRTFIDQYTPTVLALIERAGIRDRDEAMELYVWACERLAADDGARLRRHDPRKGSLEAWLSVLMRNVVVDWVRSRAGRRRLFKSIKHLSPLDRRVFELYYWEHQTTAEMIGALAQEFGAPSLGDVMDALERVQNALTERQRIELLAMTVRTSTPISLDVPDDQDERPVDAPDPHADTEQYAQARQVNQMLEEALREIPAEDAAIVRLKFVEGLSLKQIRDMLHLSELTDERVRGILDAIKSWLALRRVGAVDADVPGLAFLEGGRS
jgi:DNA-directed RNA polymerase specialized sigma24 family protein